jgi:hypothetical protein
VTTAERRRICTLLGLQGTVRLDNENGYRLGRSHGYQVEWTGVLPIRCSDREFVNIQTVWVGEGSGTPAKVTSE